MGYDLRNFGIFGPNVLGLWGVDVVLPDGTCIRATFRETEAAVVDEYSNITYAEYVLRIPPDGLETAGDGKLAAEQVVSIKQHGNKDYYVANVAPADYGWWIATLQDHTPRPC